MGGALEPEEPRAAREEVPRVGEAVEPKFCVEREQAGVLDVKGRECREGTALFKHGHDHVGVEQRGEDLLARWEHAEDVLRRGVCTTHLFTKRCVFVKRARGVSGGLRSRRVS